MKESDCSKKNIIKLIAIIQSSMLIYIYFIIFYHFLFEDSLVSASLCSKIVLIIYTVVMLKRLGTVIQFYVFIHSCILSFVQQG